MAALRIPTVISTRNFSNTPVNYGRNLMKFFIPQLRGTDDFRKRQKENPDPEIEVYKWGTRDPGYTLDGKFHEVPEMIPELVVPDLTGFQLKPYVSYRVKEVVQAEFTAVDLFDAIYRPKIEKDFEENKLDENGQPLEPNAVEMLTAEEAKEAALKTGSDLFTVNKQPAY